MSQEDRAEGENQIPVKEVLAEAKVNEVAVKVANEELTDKAVVSVNLAVAEVNVLEEVAQEETQEEKVQKEILAVNAAGIQDRTKEIEIRDKFLENKNKKVC